LAEQVKTMTVTKLNTHAPESPSAAVLVVEDDPILRSTLAFEVSDAGFRVREAANADEAEKIVLAGTPIDLVITDIEMPGPRNGLDLAKTVRAYRPQIKVIVASGIVPRTGIVGIADAFFGKPYDVSRIILRMESLLRLPPRSTSR
jgi:DNA-binding response OmpR family regulator